jgi:hypothetical protein
MKLLALITTVASLATQAAAWGQDGQSSCYANCPCLLSLTPAFVLLTSSAGHKIVATIAQVHLHPTAKQALCKILPAEAKCHLAPVAAWADQVRGRHPETGPMHYINREFQLRGRHSPCSLIHKVSGSLYHSGCLSARGSQRGWISRERRVLSGKTGGSMTSTSTMKENQKKRGLFANVPKPVLVIKASERDLVSFLSLNTSCFPSL